MIKASTRAAVVNLALYLLDSGDDKEDLSSIFREISTILRKVNNEMVRTELRKELKCLQLF